MIRHITRMSGTVNGRSTAIHIKASQVNPIHSNSTQPNLTQLNSTRWDDLKRNDTSRRPFTMEIHSWISSFSDIYKRPIFCSFRILLLKDQNINRYISQASPLYSLSTHSRHPLDLPDPSLSSIISSRPNPIHKFHGLIFDSPSL